MANECCSEKWIVIQTQTGIMAEGRNPAHVIVETYEKVMDAYAAFVQMYADKVAVLGMGLEYAAIDTDKKEARIFGSVEVIVIAMRELPDAKETAK